MPFESKNPKNLGTAFVYVPRTALAKFHDDPKILTTYKNKLLEAHSKTLIDELKPLGFSIPSKRFLLNPARLAVMKTIQILYFYLEMPGTNNKTLSRQLEYLRQIRMLADSSSCEVLKRKKDVYSWNLLDIYVLLHAEDFSDPKHEKYNMLREYIGITSPNDHRVCQAYRRYITRVTRTCLDTLIPDFVNLSEWLFPGRVQEIRSAAGQIEQLDQSVAPSLTKNRYSTFSKSHLNERKQRSVGFDEGEQRSVRFQLLPGKEADS